MMLSNCGVGEDYWVSLGQQGDQTSQSVLKEINPEYSLVLKLKLQYLGCLMRTANLLEKTLILGKIEGKRRRGQQRMRCLDSIINSMDLNVRNLQETVKDREAWRAAVQSWRWLSDWTTNNNIIYTTFDIYNGILLSHKKKEIIPYAVTWMDLVIIRLSEVSQKEKDKYFMISLIRGI